MSEHNYWASMCGSVSNGLVFMEGYLHTAKYNMVPFSNPPGCVTNDAVRSLVGIGKVMLELHSPDKIVVVDEIGGSYGHYLLRMEDALSMAKFCQLENETQVALDYVYKLVKIGTECLMKYNG